jgi:sugar lactone lactonase YvrE
MLGAVAIAALGASGANAGLLTQDACTGAAATVEVWKQLGSDVLENLLFAAGSLWISDSSAGRVHRFDPSGAQLASIPIASPGGLALGSDGLIYAGEGNAIVQSLLRTHSSRVVVIDPNDTAAPPQPYASGFDMVNGMTFGPGDDLFISNDVGNGLIRIPRANPSAWSLFADVWGTNGLVIDPGGTNLYAAITFDGRSPIARVPLAAPSSHHAAAQLTFGFASLEPAVYTDGDPSQPLLGVKGLDDMTRDAAGTLYVVANGTGELLRVDPSTGDACLIATGLQNPSSVRIAPAPFATAGASQTFFVTEFSGAIRRISIR